MPGLSSIDGIVSGLDTTSIVEALMQFERLPVVRLENQQTEKTNIITALKALQAKVLALKTQVKLLSRVTAFEAASIRISDDSVIDATATGRVGAGSYDIQVLSMARNHQIASQGFGDQLENTFGTGTITVSVGDGSQHTLTIDSTNNSLIGIKKEINDAKLGVQAYVINDGSSSNPYRLVLSAEETGVANRISIQSDLVGGDSLDYENASFDYPEVVSFNSGTTSEVSLGATAAYTGNENKIYTFTVAGTGEQTVGTDNITINWTDGTNSGAIIVTQADYEVELVGDGADGLKLSLSAGVLNEGDTFQVASFAPLLQEACDAKLAFGSSGGSGSPITVTSEDNRFTDVIGGVSLQVKKETDAGESVNIGTDVDVAAIRASISSFIDAYNDVMDFIDQQNTYDQDTNESGVLFGDLTLHMVQDSIRSAIGLRVGGFDSRYNQLYSVGIRTGFDGKLSIRNNSRLETALRENLDEVIRLFTSSGTGSSTYLEFVSATAATKVGESYEVDVTHAATQATFQGEIITDPATTPLMLTSTNNRLKFSVDGIYSDEIVLAERTYNSAEELVTEIQQKIYGDDKIGNRGVTVEWVSSGTGIGYLKFTGSSYGSTTSVDTITTISNPAFSVLGLANGTGQAGADVEGTINGESATGTGRFLLGDEGNATTEGLKLKVTIGADQLGDGPEGTVTITKGIAARLGDRLDSFTMVGDGLFDRRIKAFNSQVEQIKDRIEDYEERLALRQQSLYRKFIALEEVLGRLSVQSTYLEGQLAGIRSNWNVIRSNNR